MIVRQKLISISLLQLWIEQISSPVVKQRIQETLWKASNEGREYINLEEEAALKQIVRSQLDSDCLRLLEQLMKDCNGLNWQPPTPGCPSHKLVSMGLARYDGGRGERLLKATKHAFQREILFLIGLTNSY